jgi:two-component system response regulator
MREAGEKGPFNVLMVEDSQTDVMLTREALDDSERPIRLHVVDDGVQAMAFLRREGAYQDSARPDLILLDLNLPRRNGMEALIEIKNDDRFRAIPVVILTTSKAETDIRKAYENYANCFITKPLDFDAFASVVRSIQSFWFTTVTLGAR